MKIAQNYLIFVFEAIVRLCKMPMGKCVFVRAARTN